MAMTSRCGWGCAMLWVLAWPSGFAAGAAERRPNVIILMPDQMRGQAMGVAGNAQVRTPHLDRLAREGMFLPNTFANNPVCCPARATIMTGKYPHGHGLIINDLRLRESERTMAEVLADAGYATAFVGKWHLDGGVRLPGFVPPGARRQGFQFWAANQCNHNHSDSAYFRDSDEPLAIKRFETEVWMDEAMGFVRANRDRPFFLWWACGPPHNPYAAPPEFEKLYDPAELVMRPNWQEGTRFGSREDIARYYAAVTAIDEQLGRLMRLLDELGLADDTIILFTSDHGDMLGSQGSAFKCQPWDESIRVPGIVRYPRGIAGGQRSDMLISHVDFMPTLLSLCGVSAPDDLHGRDLSGRLMGRTARSGTAATAEEEAVVLQIYEPRQQLENVPAGWRGVRTKRYTYARFEDRPWMLHDLQEDPYERRNLVDDPAHDALRERLEGMIRREMARTQDTWETNCREHLTLYRSPAVYSPAERTGEQAPPSR